MLGLPLCLLVVLGIHSVVLFVHLLSCLLQMWPAHLHFRDLIAVMMSLTLVFLLIHEASFLYLSVTPIIILSCALCIDISLMYIFLVRLQVSAP